MGKISRIELVGRGSPFWVAAKVLRSPEKAFPSLALRVAKRLLGPQRGFVALPFWGRQKGFLGGQKGFRVPQKACRLLACWADKKLFGVAKTVVGSQKQKGFVWALLIWVAQKAFGIAERFLGCPKRVCGPWFLGSAQGLLSRQKMNSGDGESRPQLRLPI